MQTVLSLSRRGFGPSVAQSQLLFKVHLPSLQWRICTFSSDKNSRSFHLVLSVCNQRSIDHLCSPVFSFAACCPSFFRTLFLFSPFSLITVCFFLQNCVVSFFSGRPQRSHLQSADWIRGGLYQKSLMSGSKSSHST